MDLILARQDGPGDRDRRSELQAAVWALSVVVLDEDAKGVFEGAAADDQEPVEAFVSDGAHEALGVGVRLRRTDRGLDDGDAFAAEDFVEGRR